MLPPFPPSPAAAWADAAVSIVVNNYNYGGVSPVRIRSALEQRGAEIEVIVVDDGSTDSSREMIARFADRVRPVYQQNLGQKGAFNSGFAAANGDIVMFLDADDDSPTGTAAAVAEAFAAAPRGRASCLPAEVVDRAGRATGSVCATLKVRARKRRSPPCRAGVPR